MTWLGAFVLLAVGLIIWGCIADDIGIVLIGVAILWICTMNT